MNYTKIVRASAIYDLIITTPFMFPPIAKAIIAAAQPIGEAFGLRTELELTADSFMWISLMASTVTLWSLIRIMTPETRFGLYDGLNRISFSFWFLYYPIAYGASELSYMFLGPEIAWAVVQLWGYWKIKS